jgi:membrane associated rhomboid family serine protease
MVSFTYFADQVDTIIQLFKDNAETAAYILAVFWLAYIANVLVGKRLNILGIWPRHLIGLPGIFISPFLHGNLSHLFFNSIPLFLLSMFMLASTGAAFWPISLMIIFGGGLLTWLLGRNAIHIGASGLVMGYWGFLLVLAFYHPSVANIVVAVIMMYYLGGLALNLLPAGETVSVEGHIFGCLAGGASAVLWVRYAPQILQLWQHISK